MNDDTENEYLGFSTLLTKYFIQSNNITKDTEYRIYEVDAKSLITSDRIDLVAKWLYIDFRERGLKSDYGEEIYKKHLEAFSNGTYSEPGTPTKNSYQKYKESFDLLIDEIKINGFSAKKSLIPVGRNNVILDGSHRIACCAYFNEKVTVIEFPNISRRYDLEFFKQRGLGKNYLDQLAVEYCKLNQNTYAACLWPRVYRKNDSINISKIINKQAKLVFSKEIQLTQKGLKNLILQVYGHHDWVGTYTNKFRGSSAKADACFGGDGKMKVFVFECDSLENTMKIKQSIREFYGIDKHSIHITDRQVETIQTMQLLFNNNSVHHLNHASPELFGKTHKLMGIFKDNVLSNNLNMDDYIIDSSSVLSIYGIRKANDLDYISANNKLILQNKDIDNHNSQLIHYEHTKDDLIYNPKNYFYFKDIKFLSLHQTIKMKKNRDESKDKQDVLLATSFTDGKRFGLRIARTEIAIKLGRFGRRNSNRIIWLLTILRLKKPILYLYLKIQ